MSDDKLKQLEEQNAALQQQLNELKSQTPDGDRTAYLEAELKKVIKARDELKEERRLAEEKQLAEQGEFKTIAEQKSTELAEAIAGQQELKTRLDEQEELLNLYKKRDEEELKALVEKVPEALRDTVDDATLPLEKRLVLARKLASEPAGKPPAGYRPPGEPAPDSLEAQLDLAKKNGDVMGQISLKRQIAEQANT